MRITKPIAETAHSMSRELRQLFFYDFLCQASLLCWSFHFACVSCVFLIVYLQLISRLISLHTVCRRESVDHLQNWFTPVPKHQQQLVVKRLFSSGNSSQWRRKATNMLQHIKCSRLVTLTSFKRSFQGTLLSLIPSISKCLGGDTSVYDCVFQYFDVSLCFLLVWQVAWP